MLSLKKIIGFPLENITIVLFIKDYNTWPKTESKGTAVEKFVFFYRNIHLFFCHVLLLFYVCIATLLLDKRKDILCDISSLHRMVSIRTLSPLMFLVTIVIVQIRKESVSFPNKHSCISSSMSLFLCISVTDSVYLLCSGLIYFNFIQIIKHLNASIMFYEVPQVGSL